MGNSSLVSATGTLLMLSVAALAAGLIWVTATDPLALLGIGTDPRGLLVTVAGHALEVLR